MAERSRGPLISPMLIVSDPVEAADWYKKVLGAKELWRIEAHLVALHVDGTPFLLREATPPGNVIPDSIGGTTVSIELFCDNPDEFVERARAAGAPAGEVQDHHRFGGIHRQGGFKDPWGHNWLVGD